MAPECDSYEDRKCHTKLTPILNVVDNTSQQYITKILRDDRHCLHKLATSSNLQSLLEDQDAR